MSGVVAVCSRSGIDADPRRYAAALRRLAHRGPDGEGSVQRRHVFVGVRRSSVGRGTEGQQPLVGGDGALIVALDGQIHNRERLAHELSAKGFEADLSSDSALVLGAYMEYGERFVERLRGVWALVVWDEREHRMLLSRDPLGVRPLYYYISATHLYVASEIKGIIGLDPEARRMDHGRIRDLVRDSRIDDWTGTCFSRIRPVAPGTVMKYADGHVTARRYWVLRPSPDPTLSPGDVLATLVEAVKRHTPSGVDLGLALSGGIDSSSLAGILAHSALPETGSVQAFSITPPNTIDESALIDATIRHTGIRHTYVGLDSLDYSQSLGRLIDSHDEPVQYCGVFYQFVLRDYMAKAGCRAVMVGYGADEIFGGYTYLAPAFLIALALRGRFGECARFVRGATEFLESSPLGIVNRSRQGSRHLSTVRFGFSGGGRSVCSHVVWRRGRAAGDARSSAPGRPPSPATGPTSRPYAGWRIARETCRRVGPWPGRRARNRNRHSGTASA